MSTTIPEKDTNLISGKGASDPGSPVLSVNTRQSIYYPGDTAEVMIVVLDGAGVAVSGACIGMNVTAPDGSTGYVSTAAGSIVETPDPGVYEAVYLTGANGQYNITCTAVIDIEEGEESRFDTYFMVRDFYEFDIVRQAQSKIDPTKYDTFDVTVDITSHTAADTVTIREYVPVNFTVRTDASVVEAAGFKVLRWQRSLADNKTSVNYSYSVPMVWPELYRLGPVEIDSGSGTFTEGRPWWVAVDPDGSNCIFCHDSGGDNQSVDVSSMNQSDNIHASLNSNMNDVALTNTSNSNNSMCWGCHVTDGNEPTSHTDVMNNPYKCYECHNDTESAPHINISGPVVKEHFKGGDNITAVTDVADANESCIVCHNKTEMKMGYTEPDSIWNASSFASHYGKKRVDLVANTSAYCMYCHNNSTTAFPVTNNSMANHRDVEYSCMNQSCHVGGRIHNESHNKIVNCWDVNCHFGCTEDTITHSFSMPSRPSCLYCHNNKTLNNTNYDITKKLDPLSYNTKTTIHSNNTTSSNNNTLSPLCTECHTKTADEIQAGYENASKGYAMMDDNSTLAPYGSNMTHERDTVVSRWGTDPPLWGIYNPPGSSYTNPLFARHANPNTSEGWQPSIPSRVKHPNQICINCHSIIVEDTQKIGGCAPNLCHNLWTELPSAHELSRTDCSYCHSSYTGLHSGSLNSEYPLPKDYTRVPRIGLMLDESEHKNMTLNGNEGCLVCHTNVTFTLNYSTANELSIEITDYSGVHIWNSNPDCTDCHSSDADYLVGELKEHWDSRNNTQCLECHNSSTKIIGRTPGYEYQHGHDVQKGKAGPNCISCHDQGTDISALINVSAVRQGIHSGIQNYTNIGVVGASDWRGKTINESNRICWACHMDDGNWTDGPANTSHADNLKFNTTPGTSDDDPYTCYDCHNSTSKPYDNAQAKWWNVTEHFSNGTNIKAGVKGNSGNDSSCLICHNKSFMRITSGFESNNSDFSLVSHYGRNRSDLRTWDGHNTVNCYYCHNSSSSDFQSGADNFNDTMITPAFNASVPEHSLNASNFGSNSPNCTDSKCHVGGWMHNDTLTKPALMPGGDEDSAVCNNCHSPANASGNVTTGGKNLHNNTLNCSECHLSEARDIHGVKYLQQDDTYSTSNISAVNCQDCHASNSLSTNITAARPKVPMQTDFNFTHSQVSNNGCRWNATPYWTTTNGACEYCHNDTKHSISALGRITNISNGNAKNTSIDDDTWCSGCHWKGDSNYDSMSAAFGPVGIAPEITNGTCWEGISTDYFNHTLFTYNDSACKHCHGSLLVEKTTKEFPHRVAEGTYGANCTWCHDISGDVAPRINVTALNSTFSIHSNVSTYDAIFNPYSSNTSNVNKICWLCHMNDSNAPGNYTDHADRVRTSDNILSGPVPFTCDECHVVGVSGSVNASVLVWAPDVVQHFAQAGNLTAGNTSDNLTSCRNCHNLTGMKVTSNLPAIQGLNSTGWLSLVSHYGKKRSVTGDPSNLRTWNGGVDCSYCHQDGGNEFGNDSIMANKAFNASVPEHSRYVSTPNCTNATCHDGGWMHNASLAKPDLTTTPEDSAICLACHDSTNYSTYAVCTTAKEKHNNTLHCTECHLYAKQDIHGVKYLQQNGTYGLSNASSDVVTCQVCHNSNAVDSNITATDRPKIPANGDYMFAHSEEPANGSRWANASAGNYWTSVNGACQYCHNDTLHSTSALGNINWIMGSNVRNQTLGTSPDNWCGGCHYQAAGNYNGSNWTKVPPTIVINNVNLSNTTDDSTVKYFEHTLPGYTDTDCNACHGGLLNSSITSTSKEFVHRAAVGVFGPDCIYCHGEGNGAVAARINVSVVNSTLGIHSGINYSAIPSLTNVSDDNKICWACHMDNGFYDSSNVTGYTSTGMATGDHADRWNQNLSDDSTKPYYCDTCHVIGSESHPNDTIKTKALDVIEHFANGTDLHAGNSSDNLTSCKNCHNITEMRVAATLPADANSSSWLSLVSHYGKKRSTGADNLRTLDGSANCSYCHQNGGNEFGIDSIMANKAFNASVPEHSPNASKFGSNSPNCTDSKCHVGGWMHNDTLTKPALMPGGDEDSAVCNNCHSPANASGNVTTGGKNLHNNTLNCSECHMFEARDIHGVKYLQKSTGTYSTDNSTAVDCQGCHNSDIVDDNITVTARPKVPLTDDYAFAHSEDSDNGSRWANVSVNNYWQSVNGACIYCHNYTMHSTSALGNIKWIMGSNVRNQTLGTDPDNWCGGCHFQAAGNYKGSNWTKVPPTIVINNVNLSNTIDDSTVKYFNHTLISGFTDTDCKACHGGMLNSSITRTSKEFVHRAAVGVFGPDCIYCHGEGNGAVAARINVSVVNSTLGIHSGINYSAIPSLTNVNVSDDNKICWACHMDNGSYDSSKVTGYTSAGIATGDHADRWNQNLSDDSTKPYYCDACHVIGSESHPNDTIKTKARDVVEHFAGGTELHAGNSSDNLTSCKNCHNITEMKVAATLPPDANSSSWLSLVSHYGKKRSTGTDDIRTWGGGVNCSYCHQNNGNEFGIDSIMANKTFNANVPEHSLNASNFGSTSPRCNNSTCHAGGWMHNDTLTKPELMPGGAEDSAVCNNCHSPANASGNNVTTGGKNLHNNGLNCTECHLSEARDIHGVRYLQKNGTYSTSNTSAVDCLTCHSSDAVNNNISVTIPKVPDNNFGFSHSNSLNSGSRWNESHYWNDSNGACEFCHDDTKHNSSAIGFIGSVKGVNDRNVSLDGINKSYWCSICHNSTSPYYNGTKRDPVPPTIFFNNTNNATSRDGSGQGWYNHSFMTSTTDANCKGCHGSLLSTNPTSREFVHKVAVGGGKDCVSCHDIYKSAPEKFRIDVQAMNRSDAIHYDVNRDAVDELSQNMSSNNVRCWACHGDGNGSEAAQPSAGHPDRVNKKNPRKCSEMDCHNVNQSIFNEPMIYEHFKYVDLIDENINTDVDCQACHKNSVQTNEDTYYPSDLSLVSHYGSTHDLINSSNCIYCHLDEDNSEEWGNAPDPTDNETPLSEEERNATIFVGEKWYIGSKYILYFNDISKDGDKAYIQILYDDQVINESIVTDNENFTFTQDVLDKDENEIEIVICSVNITGVFRGHENSLIIVKGKTLKRIHIESLDASCYACHIDNYTPDRTRYLILDRDDDYTYYTELYLDFDKDDINKQILSPESTQNIIIAEGNNRSWTVGEFTLTAKDVNIQGDSAYIVLELNGEVADESVYTVGETIEYKEDLTVRGHTIDDVVLFRADVDQVFHGLQADAVFLTDVIIKSDKLRYIDNDDKIGGYNASWLQKNDTFNIGGTPENLHVPSLNDGMDGSSDCVMCHDVTFRFGIPAVDAISTQLGGHAGLNQNATNKTLLTDSIDKACWACHGTGEEPEIHPANYLNPRYCKDCHSELNKPNFGAPDLSDEVHGRMNDCNRCHAADYPGVHVINVFEPDVPYITSINVSQEVVQQGQQVNVDVIAMSGWNMKIRTIEYFIDAEGPSGTGIQIKPVDGIYDEQVEEAEFSIDTSGLNPGDHTIYIHAMERDGKWGPVNKAVFSIETPLPEAQQESERSNMATILTILAGTGLAGLILLLRKSGYLFNLNEIPGNDSDKLLQHIEQNYGIDWVKTAGIEKIDDGKVVKVFTEANSLTLKLNDEKTRLYLNIDGGKTDEFIVKMKNGELKIFKKGIRYKKGII